TKRKKITIRPSFIHSDMVYRRSILLFSTPRWVPNKLSKASESGEFAIINDRIRHANNMMPPPVLESKKSLKAFGLINFAIAAKLLKIIYFLGSRFSVLSFKV